MSVFHIPELSEREFGSNLLSVAKLNDWARSKGFELQTFHQLDAYGFVQVEALLCSIGQAAQESVQDNRGAIFIAQNSPELRQHRVVKEEEHDPTPGRNGPLRQLIGNDAIRQWRDLINKAVESGELELLDFGSKLPTQTGEAASPDSEQQPAEQNARMRIQAHAEQAPRKMERQASQTPTTSPRFSMPRRVLVQRHLHHWPTIDRDLKDASDNGLDEAKAGARAWYEDTALAWATANGKINDGAQNANSLSSVMATFGATLPTIKHTIGG
jgi:hypothetical protein